MFHFKAGLRGHFCHAIIITSADDDNKDGDYGVLAAGRQSAIVAVLTLTKLCSGDCKISVTVDYACMYNMFYTFSNCSLHILWQYMKEDMCRPLYISSSPVYCSTTGFTQVILRMFFCVGCFSLV